MHLNLPGAYWNRKTVKKKSGNHIVYLRVVISSNWLTCYFPLQNFIPREQRRDTNKLYKKMTLNEYIKSSDLEVSVSGDMLETFISNNDDDDYENVTQKVNSRCFKLYRAYSILFTLSNFGKCFWSWILKECSKVQEKKKRVVLCSCPLQNVNLGTFTLSCNDDTKCTKKRDARGKVVFFLLI